MKTINKVFIILAVMAGLFALSGCTEPYTGLYYTAYKAELTKAEHDAYFAKDTTADERWEYISVTFANKPGYEKTGLLKEDELVETFVEWGVDEKEVLKWRDGDSETEAMKPGYFYSVSQTKVKFPGVYFLYVIDVPEM